MAETTYKHWLAKKKKTELIDMIYELHLELLDFKEAMGLEETEGLE
jgi:hypothetical protein